MVQVHPRVGVCRSQDKAHPSPSIGIRSSSFPSLKGTSAAAQHSSKVPHVLGSFVLAFPSPLGLGTLLTFYFPSLLVDAVYPTPEYPLVMLTKGNLDIGTELSGTQLRL